MKSVGTIRKIDELGRIVIPIEIRNKLNINEKDLLEIFIEENSIILKKFEESCVFCGSIEDLKKYKNKLVCSKCVENIIY